MKYIFTLIISLLPLIFISCNEIEGCTSNSATNYNGNATKADGSCTYKQFIVFWMDFDSANTLRQNCIESVTPHVLVEGEIYDLDPIHVDDYGKTSCYNGFFFIYHEGTSEFVWIITETGKQDIIDGNEIRGHRVGTSPNSCKKYMIKYNLDYEYCSI